MISLDEARALRPLTEANALIRRPSGAFASGAGELVDITLIAAIRPRCA